jgi:DNA ligase-associated metallophosphoesterase
LILLAERAVFWERTRTLLVADAHFGKAATFRAAAIPVPRGTTMEGIDRLDRLVRTSGAFRVLFLGDFLHARSGRAPETLGAIQRWHEANRAIRLVLVRGNHDRQAGDPPPELGVECVDAPLVEPPFVMAHHPADSLQGYVIAGHVHPGVPLYGPARQRARLPCFWFASERAVLPAFGDFTGLAEITPVQGDRVFVIAGSDVIEPAGAVAEMPPPRSL